MKATLGYNIAYFCIPLALLASGNQISEYLDDLIILFAAVFLLKTQASLADVIHDYEVDRNNPEKRVLADAADHIGLDNLQTLIAIEIAVSMGLWGGLALAHEEILFIVLGVVGIISGFIYSYPPRVKERGVFNHFGTSGIDVLLTIYPVGVLLSHHTNRSLFGLLLLVFLYSFGYHIAHQAADTYYDRQENVSTFTRDIGIPNSMLLIIAVNLLSAALAIYYGYFLATLALIAVAVKFSYIYHTLPSDSEKAQTDHVAEHFNIATLATALNLFVAASIYLA